MFKRLTTIAAAIALVSMLAPGTGLALTKLQKASGTFSVLATQFTPCSTSATNVNFGTQDFDNGITTGVAPGSSSGVITLNCGDELTEVDIGNGQNWGKDGNDPNDRSMTDGQGHYLAYVLLNSNANNPNNDTNAGNPITLPDSRNNSNVDHLTIVGQTPNNVDPAEGSYSDLVTYIVYFLQ